MRERLLALALPDHPYGHETIGYYEDVVDMPNQYAAARAFYDTYYRPNNCVVIVVGDVKADAVFQEVEAGYGKWQSKPAPVVPAAAPLQGPKREHIPWPAEVAPRLYVSYRTPRFQTSAPETAVEELLGELLVSRSAPLYKRLRFEKQTASELALAEGTQGFESFDPRLLTLDAQLFKEQYARQGKPYFDEVIADVQKGVEELQNFSRDKQSKRLLDTLKSKYRYDFLAAMASPARIAYNLAWYYRFDRDPAVFEHLLAAVNRVEPKDIDAFARKYFVPENQVVITLGPGESTPAK
jgi:zinc protease